MPVLHGLPILLVATTRARLRYRAVARRNVTARNRALTAREVLHNWAIITFSILYI